MRGSPSRRWLLVVVPALFVAGAAVFDDGPGRVEGGSGPKVVVPEPRAVALTTPPSAETAARRGLRRALGQLGASADAAPRLRGRLAVVDTGVDGNHPMLVGRVVEEVCFSADLCGPSQRGTGSGTAAPCGGLGCYHGTFVAGLAVGDGPERGVAPGAEIVAVQVASTRRCGRDGTCSEVRRDDLDAALEWLVERAEELELAVVNVSLNGALSESPCDERFPRTAAAVAALRLAGVAVVASSGNGGSRASVAFPACLSTVVSVAGATYEDGIRVLPTSNFVPGTIVAPGLDVGSAAPGGQYVSSTGSSPAAALVSGALLHDDGGPFEAMLADLTCGSSIDGLAADALDLRCS